MMPDIFVASGDKREPESGRASEHEKRRGGGGKKRVKGGRRHEKEYSEVMRQLPQTKSPLAAFVVRPKKLKFETQESQEKILLLLRKHPITNLSWILIAGLMVLAPLMLTVVPLLAFFPMRFQLVTVVFWYLMTFGFVVEQFLSWYFNVYVITDERIIDFDFYSLVYKRVSEAKIDKIEDVTFQMTGVMRSLFNYGTVYIQTAGESREFEFDDTPQPQKVVKFLNEMVLEEEREKIEGRVR